MSSDNFLIRRNLGLYGEIKFAEVLHKKGYEPFFPYKDKGIDVLAYDLERRITITYQVKSRNMSKRFGNYWFKLKSKDINNGFTADFWIFSIFKNDNKFDFINIPLTQLKNWIEQSRNNLENNILSPDKNDWWLKIEKKENEYYTIPKKGSINITQFLFK